MWGRGAAVREGDCGVSGDSVEAGGYGDAGVRRCAVADYTHRAAVMKDAGVEDYA